MDELEFRRRIMSDPKERDSDILDAMRTNESNSKFAEDILDLDSRIAKAMNVDVPEDLADRILFNQSSRNQNNVVKANFVKRSMAMAASVAFVVGLLVGQINWGNVVVTPAQASLADTAIEHVMAEKPFIANLDEQVNTSQINAKMAPFTHQLSEQFPYHVYYLNHCGFGDANALHMVFEGEKGKVTLFMTNIASSHVEDFQKQGMDGVVEPVGNASIVIVGEKGENVANIANSIKKLIQPVSI
ncbi:DUF3379 domain-containing protein [Vibrio panuliri]|uniref:Chemotaxis protein n=1 Tax=Vibrio panuliri TaxID=1381081 RepID=A0A1Q9HG67_9VIBR|nr:DUF3379 domain-containing protein [Vibrio panuliri]KAB1454943.1 DUF3379 domain-containing protein [Vibrio panuliri]OLQ88866.1 chemotaxis protein [Vibrio panuliri]OLQ95291.1 chemotaxis protein [Vibrio panuliri]